jgi:Na+:H+ antiporter, NhaA family
MPTSSPDGDTIRHAWSESERFVPRTFVRPLQRFMAAEVAGGIVLLAAAVVAVVWANSTWSDRYDQLWTTPLTIELGGVLRIDHLDLRSWVNDALMTVFFLVVGLEIKRELVHGGLRDRKAAALPAIAALGGMVVPAGIYAAFNAGEPTIDGWGVPMATDIAFAVGVLSLLGRRVPASAKVFLLTLAIADDVGAIVVIAIFYTSHLALGWLAAGLLAVVGMHVLKRIDVRWMAAYLLVGAFVWLALLESGVHATLAGVALGLMTPAWSFYDPRRFADRARPLVDLVEQAYADNRLTAEEMEHNELLLQDLQRLVAETQSPLQRIESKLTRWTAFVVVPIFALANAGVRFESDALSGAFGDPVIMGVALGLLVGKATGVSLATYAAVKLGLGTLPPDTTWRHVVGLGIVAGIGFTVALFVTDLAFVDPAATDSAKIGILAASLLAGVGGYLWLRLSPAPDARTAPEPVHHGGAPLPDPSALTRP